MAGVVTMVDNGKGEVGYLVLHHHRHRRIKNDYLCPQVGILSVENLLYEGDGKKAADSMEAFPSAEHYQVTLTLR